MYFKQSFLTPSGFYRRFCPWLSFQTSFLVVQILTPLFPLSVSNLMVFFQVIG